MKLPRLSRPSGGDSSTTQMILSAPSSRQMALSDLRVRPPPVKPGLTQHSRNQQRLEPSGNAATNQRQQIDHGQRACESSIWLVTAWHYVSIGYSDQQMGLHVGTDDEKEARREADELCSSFGGRAKILFIRKVVIQ